MTMWAINFSNWSFVDLLLCLGRGAGYWYCDQLICMCVCLSVREHISGTAGQICVKFSVQIPVAVARSSSGSIALCYVLPVLSMTSHLAVMGAKSARVGSTQGHRSIMCVIWAESDVYECLFVVCFILSSQKHLCLCM